MSSSKPPLPTLPNLHCFPGERDFGSGQGCQIPGGTKRSPTCTAHPSGSIHSRDRQSIDGRLCSKKPRPPKKRCTCGVRRLNWPDPRATKYEDICSAIQRTVLVDPVQKQEYRLARLQIKESILVAERAPRNLQWKATTIPGATPTRSSKARYEEEL